MLIEIKTITQYHMISYLNDGVFLIGDPDGFQGHSPGGHLHDFTEINDKLGNEPMRRMRIIPRS